MFLGLPGSFCWNKGLDSAIQGLFCSRNAQLSCSDMPALMGILHTCTHILHTA